MRGKAAAPRRTDRWHCRSSRRSRRSSRKSAKELPEGDGWVYEPKFDGFRTIVFKDGDDVHLQSRNGKPMNRYFPEVVEAIGKMKADRARDRRRDHRRGRRRPGVRPARPAHPPGGVAREDARREVAGGATSRSTCWPRATRSLMELPYARAPQAAAEGRSASRSRSRPRPTTARRAGQWLTGHSEGVVAKKADSPYLPGERKGMVKIKRVRTADLVVAAFRFGKEEGTLGSLILGAYDDDGELHVVGHTSGFKAKEKRELIDKLEPYRTGERGSGEAEPLEVRRGARLGGPAAGAGGRGRTSTTSPATASATARSSSAGARTRSRASARWSSCGADDPARRARTTRPRCSRIDRATWSRAVVAGAVGPTPARRSSRERTRPEDVLVAERDGQRRRLGEDRAPDAAAARATTSGRHRAGGRPERRRAPASAGADRGAGRRGALARRPPPDAARVRAERARRAGSTSAAASRSRACCAASSRRATTTSTTCVMA